MPKEKVTPSKIDSHPVLPPASELPLKDDDGDDVTSPAAVTAHSNGSGFAGGGFTSARDAGVLSTPMASTFGATDNGGSGSTLDDNVPAAEVGAETKSGAGAAAASADNVNARSDASGRDGARHVRVSEASAASSTGSKSSQGTRKSVSRLRETTSRFAASRKFRQLAKTSVVMNTLVEEQHIRDKIFGRRGDEGDADTDAFRAAATTDTIVLPGSKFARVWDSLLIVVLIWIAGRVPVRACFPQPTTVNAWLAFDYFFDACLVIDLCLRFRRARLDDGEVVADPARIALSYLRNRFVLDLASSFPLTWFVPHVDSVGRRWHVLRMLQMLRLLEFEAAEAAVAAWANFGHQTRHAFRLVKLLALIFITGHVAACVWVYVDLAQRSLAGDAAGSPGSLTWADDYGIGTETTAAQYLSALYWAYATMTSVGYGDVKAVTDVERGYSVVIIFLGAMLFAVTVGRMSALQQEKNATKLKMRKKILSINEFVKFRNLPRDLRARVREYYDFVANGRLYIDEAKLMEDMSPALRRAVALHLNRDILDTVPIFKYGGTGFQMFIVTMLKPVVGLQGEYLVVAGEFVRDMWFLRSGSVQLVDSTGAVVTTLENGAFFGERWLLDRVRADESVRCARHCELYSLSRSNMAELLEAFPEFEDTIRKVSVLRGLHSKMQDRHHTGTGDGTTIGGGPARKSSTPQKVPPPLGVASWSAVRDSNDFSKYYRDLLNNSRMLQASQYKPKPANLRGVRVPRALQPLQELIAHNSHEVWADTRVSQGWRYGPSRDNTRKLHPDLVPYGELPDEARRYDREASEQMLKLIVMLGWTCVPAGDEEAPPRRTRRISVVRDDSEAHDSDRTVPPVEPMESSRSVESDGSDAAAGAAAGGAASTGDPGGSRRSLDTDYSGRDAPAVGSDAAALKQPHLWEFGKRSETVDGGTTYRPRPFPTSVVEIPDELEDLVNHMANFNHEVWAKKRMSEGWTWGVRRDDAKKLHNCLLPFALLSPEEQSVDVYAVVETIKLLIGLGYNIVRTADRRRGSALQTLRHNITRAQSLTAMRRTLAAVSDAPAGTYSAMATARHGGHERGTSGYSGSAAAAAALGTGLSPLQHITSFSSATMEAVDSPRTPGPRDAGNGALVSALNKHAAILQRVEASQSIMLHRIEKLEDVLSAVTSTIQRVNAKL